MPTFSATSPDYLSIRLPSVMCAQRGGLFAASNARIRRDARLGPCGFRLLPPVGVFRVTGQQKLLFKLVRGGQYPMKKFGLSVVCLVAAALLLAACGSSNNSSSSTSGSSSGAASSSGGKGGKIAFLLPESKTARYETQDRPLFEKKVKALCPSCSVVYSNADQDASKQQQQAEAALTQGVKVMVLDPVDGAAAAAIVNQANSKGVPVISYDRLLLNSKPDYYVEFNSPSVGKIQGKALSDKLGGKGTIVMINGAPTDNNAKLFKQGAHSVLDAAGIKIAKEHDTPDWSPDKAQSEMEQAITAVGKGK